MNKKTLLIGLICVCLLLPAWATRRAYYPSAPAEGLGQGTASMSSQITWNVLDATTSADDEVTDLAGGECTFMLVKAAILAAAANPSDGDGEISWARFPPTWNKIRFRCIGVGDGDDITHQIYFGSVGNGTDCELVKAGQLAWVIGTQASTTTDYEMADAVTVTEYCWIMPWSKKSPSSNLVAEAAIDVVGADLIVIVTTVADGNCKLLGKGI